MSEEKIHYHLTKTIQSSLENLDLRRLKEQMEADLQAAQNNNLMRGMAKRLVFGIFTHMRKDPAVASEYIPMLRDLAENHASIHHVLLKSISKKGRCPKFARSSIRQLLNSTNLAHDTKIDNETDIEIEIGDEVGIETADAFDVLQKTINYETIINEVLGLDSISQRKPLTISEAVTSLGASMRRIKYDLINCKNSYRLSGDIPSNLALLAREAKHYYRESDEKRSSNFLQLAKVYTERNSKDLLRFSLAQYCFSMGRQQFNTKKRDARPYLQSFLFLYQRIPVEGRRELEWELYNVLAFYLGTYNIYVNVRENQTSEISNKFYSNFLIALSSVDRQGQFQTLGRCIVEIAVANSQFVYDLVNRIKTRGDEERAFLTIVKSLRSSSTFRAAPLQCLQLLERIDSGQIAFAISQQSLSSASERIPIITALLEYAKESSLQPSSILKGFAQQASANTRKDLAFSILIEPVERRPSVEGSELKAKLVAETLGFPAGTNSTEYFLSRATELSDLLAKFSQSDDPDIKGRYGYNILETIRLTRKWLADGLYGGLKREVIQFFRAVDSYVTAEQAKLIRDTVLDLRLVNDRAPYSPTNTRIVVEIRNVGEGTADGLELEVFPIEGTYKVEERYRVHRIDILADKTPLQKEILIQPTIDVNESLNLSVILRYNTLKEKGKKAELEENNRTVQLYPVTQFVRVYQPYNIGEPATTWFYGRQDILEGMADNLRTGPDHSVSMIVYGLKRTGKTSVVKRFIEYTLRERELAQVYWPVYVDLLKDSGIKKVSNDGDFLYFLIQLMNEALPTRIDVRSFSDDFQSDSFEAFSFLLEGMLETIYPHKLLLVLDEFSVLQGQFRPISSGGVLSEEVFGFLSNVIQSTSQLTFIFTGTYVLMEMMREHAFDLAKICEPRMVSFLDEASARRLIEEPVGRDKKNPDRGWLEYDPRVIDRIITVTNCHPYLIQHLCMQLVNRMNKRKHNYVNLNDINSIIDNTISRPAYAMPILTLWNEFDAPQHKVLSAVAANSGSGQSQVEVTEIVNTFRGRGDSMQVEDILTTCLSLVDAELLEKYTSEGTDSYKISIPLYQMWLKQNKSLVTVFGR